MKVLKCTRVSKVYDANVGGVRWRVSKFIPGGGELRGAAASNLKYLPCFGIKFRFLTLQLGPRINWVILTT